MKPSRRLIPIALLLAAPAVAGPIEDGFRAYLDRLKAAGQQLPQALGGAGAAPQASKPTLAKRTDELPLGRSQYAVFVAPGCRACDQAVQHMRSQKMAFDVLDLGKSATAREAYPLLKAQGVPAVLVGRYMVSGWDQRLFERAIAADAQDQARSMQGQGG